MSNYPSRITGHCTRFKQKMECCALDGKHVAVKRLPIRLLVPQLQGILLHHTSRSGGFIVQVPLEWHWWLWLMSYARICITSEPKYLENGTIDFPACLMMTETYHISSQLLEVPNYQLQIARGRCVCEVSDPRPPSWTITSYLLSLILLLTLASLSLPYTSLLV